MRRARGYEQLAIESSVESDKANRRITKLSKAKIHFASYIASATSPPLLFITVPHHNMYLSYAQQGSSDQSVVVVIVVITKMA